MKIFNTIRNWLWPAGSRTSGYLVREPYAGAWQRNDEIVLRDPSSFSAVYACVNRIAEDVSKLRIGLVKEDENGIWVKHKSSAYDPVLRRCNAYQNSQQFFQSWIYSLLLEGNTYVLKERDKRGVVIALHVLDPRRVRPVVASDGDHAYEADGGQELAGLTDQETVLIPKTEMIHDRISAFVHPLVGISPLIAAADSIAVAQEIQRSTLTLHKNSARVSGVLTAPGSISDETAEQLRLHWKDNFTGANAGKVAVLADGLSYKSFDIVDSASGELVDHLKLSAEVVCSVFAVPVHLVQMGDGASVKYDNISVLNQMYYNFTLMPRLEAIESLLNEGLGLALDTSTEFDTGALLRLDVASMIEAQAAGLNAGLFTTNEGRKALNLGPVPYGDEIYQQRQYAPLSQLAKQQPDEEMIDVNRHFRTLHKIKRIEERANDAN